MLGKDEATMLLAEQWRAMLTAHAEGVDVPAAMQWRCEGFMEACAQLGILSPSDQDAKFLEVWEVLAEHKPISLDDWRTMHPFPALPLWQRPAPVRPSTKVRVEWFEPDQG